MMKNEPPPAPGGNGASGGNSGSSNLRSPPRQKNAYEAGLAALKKATDHLNNAANRGVDVASKPALLPRPTGRGRRYGSNVHRIKNMFMQMQSPGDEEDGAKMIGKEEELKLSLPRASSLNENVNHSALLKLGATVSERVNRFDSKPAGADGASSIGLSKLQETRRIFEQQTLQEKQAATNRILLKKERASGFQGSRLDVVARFNGSTEALDRLDDPPSPTTVPSTAAPVAPGDAVSPTVSQLSAAFEKGDLQNNIHAPRCRSAPALAPKPKMASRADTANKKAPPSGKEVKEDKAARVTDTQAADLPEGSTPRSPEGPPPGGIGQCSSATVASSSSEDKSESRVQSVTAGAGPELDQDHSPGTETGGRLVEAQVHAPFEKGEKEASSFPPSSDVTAADSEWRDEEEEDGSRKEDYSEGDLVEVSAYSGLGEEDSGGSQLDDEEEDEEDEEAYQPESSCSEIPGLPEEEEPAPASRKIRFSTEPIKVFTTYSNKDYDRRNDDVDPMAASAEYELEKRVEKLELFPVELEKAANSSRVQKKGEGHKLDQLQEMVLVLLEHLSILKLSSQFLLEWRFRIMFNSATKRTQIAA
uniref:Neurabin-1/2 PDZ domain-containing protein n=1 Tax=Nothobranchius furzeri TaxID=105023 RepID=A0A1A8VAI8_NOTFU